MDHISKRSARHGFKVRECSATSVGLVSAVRRTRVERGRGPTYPQKITQRSLFRSFKTSPEMIRLGVRLYLSFPLSLQNVEELRHGQCQRNVA
jgi:hypothetical protein